MKAFLALTAAVIALATTGCAAGGQPDAAPQPEQTESTSDGGLGLKLLTESDLPAGFAEMQLPTVKDGMGALVGCPALDVRPSAQQGEASVSFAGATAGSFIHESIRLVSADQAKQEIAAIAALPAQCSNAKTASISAMGLQSTAIQLTATPAQLGTSIEAYLMAVRDDQTVVVIAFVSPGTADPAAAESVTKTAWDKASAKS